MEVGVMGTLSYSWSVKSTGDNLGLEIVLSSGSSLVGLSPSLGADTHSR